MDFSKIKVFAWQMKRKLNRYDFTKQKCTTLIQVLVVVLGFMPFAVYKLNMVPILQPIDCFRLVPWDHIISVCAVIISLICYTVLVIYALGSIYNCLMMHEAYFDNQAKTIEYDIKNIAKRYGCRKREYKKGKTRT
ncbi:hypothetical protein [Helicobacter acinonychis]|uniref:hypothetical protein n=1 Tax=Helicobacter acinonychis TaxID=212 RepID=UPI0013154D11|nr:hypothetical protein [Helicobacter acinonychis]